jgi:hypothetical protein
MNISPLPIPFQISRLAERVNFPISFRLTWVNFQKGRLKTSEGLEF